MGGGGIPNDVENAEFHLKQKINIDKILWDQKEKAELIARSVKECSTS